MIVYIVAEIIGNKIIGSNTFPYLDDAIDCFCDTVREYGIEPYDTMIDSRICETENDGKIQIRQLIVKK